MKLNHPNAWKAIDAKFEAKQRRRHREQQELRLCQNTLDMLAQYPEDASVIKFFFDAGLESQRIKFSRSASNEKKESN